MLPQLYSICALVLPLLAVISSCRGQNVKAGNVNFSFADFKAANPMLLKDGNCSVDLGVLQLNRNSSDTDLNASQGLLSRAVYADLVQFYDAATGAEASFNVSFVFGIKPVSPGFQGDGMAFIIAPTSKVPTIAGGSLGLFNVNTSDLAEDSTLQFVAVEFDNFYNGWDPPNDSNHVGLDINSIASTRAQNLSEYGITLTDSSLSILAPGLSAWIDYSAEAQELLVYMSKFVNGNQKSGASLVLNYTGLNVSSIVREYSYVGFTASTGGLIQNIYIYNWTFSTSGLPQPAKSSTGLVAGVATGGALLVLALGCGLGWFFCCRSGKSRSNSVQSLIAGMMVDKASTSSTGRSSDPSGTSSVADVDMTYWTRTFTYQELKKATLGFSKSHILGQGGFGSVYRGVMRIGDSDVELAIKRIAQDSRQGAKEFRAELQILGQLRHRNLVHLYGWCQERDELLLVYDYMPNLSLDRHLYSSQQVLSWTDRFRIVRGVATALVYIHTEWRKCILHRDIKPANVLLDSNMEARLGDFGLSRLMEETIATRLTLTQLAGTFGYMPPELAISGQATAKSDLFSFGVLLLEVASGRRPRVPNQEIQLLDWVWQMQEAGNILDVADPALAGEFDPKQLTCVLYLGLMCTHPDPSLRPSTRRVQQILNGDVQLPSLPRSRPVAVYTADDHEYSQENILPTESTETPWLQSSSFSNSLVVV